MAKDGTWGGNMELVALSRACQTNITVHQLNTPRFNIYCNDGVALTQGGSGGVDRNIHVSYHDFEHYSSVRKESEFATHKPASSIEITSKAGDIISQKTAVVPAGGDSGLADGPKTKAEKIVSENTKCSDMARIREVLKECKGNVDEAVEIIM